jgi:hypothetical protein
MNLHAADLNAWGGDEAAKRRDNVVTTKNAHRREDVKASRVLLTKRESHPAPFTARSNVLPWKRLGAPRRLRGLRGSSSSAGLVPML